MIRRHLFSSLVRYYERRRRSLMAAFIGAVLSAVPAAVCFGEDAGGTPDPLGREAPGLYEGSGAGETVWMLLQVIFFLLLIIGLFFLIMKIVSKKNRYWSGKALRSLGGIPLGPNKSVQVLEIGEAVYIVGVGDNVQLLDKIDGKEEAMRLKELVTGPGYSASPAAGFGQMKGWLAGLTGRNEPPAEESLVSFQEVFHSKMRNVTERKKQVEQLLKEEQQTDRLNDKP